ncbi:copper resistance CopC family protein [Nonomuraea sp. NPDC050310]|uniref:copper resistance CopC family protein n=1 Tax=unclassified Nonomuraea TaxID=2593643 RepID=UPI0033E45AFC
MKRSPLAALTALLAALFAAVLVAGTAGPALAHDVLKGSDPKKGSTVKALEQVRLEFSASVRMPYVIVRDSGGKQFEDGDAEVEGKVVTQAVKTLPDGAYTMAYRVISSDGHPIEGEIPFKVEGAEAPETSAPATQATPAPTESAGAATWSATKLPETDSPAASPEAASPAAAEQPQEEGGGFPIWLIIVVGAVVGIGIGFLISAKKAGPKP